MTHAYEHQLCYAAMGPDELRAVSSSGGAFSILARWILSQGGVVYGAAFDDRMECRYEEAADESGLSRLRGSKYVKAELSRVAIEGVRRRLADGVPVLFVGVPCQVAAVKNLCKDDLRNLYTIDLVCNGTPAREMFRRYLDDNWGALQRAKDKYGQKIEVRNPGRVGCVTFLSNDPAVPVDDLIKEFGLILWDDYYDRSVKLRGGPLQ